LCLETSAKGGRTERGLRSEINRRQSARGEKKSEIAKPDGGGISTKAVRVLGKMQRGGSSGLGV